MARQGLNCVPHPCGNDIRPFFFALGDLFLWESWLEQADIIRFNSFIPHSLNLHQACSEVAAQNKGPMLIGHQPGLAPTTTPEIDRPNRPKMHHAEDEWV